MVRSDTDRFNLWLQRWTGAVRTAESNLEHLYWQLRATRRVLRSGPRFPEPRHPVAGDGVRPPLLRFKLRQNKCSVYPENTTTRFRALAMTIEEGALMSSLVLGKLCSWKRLPEH